MVMSDFGVKLVDFDLVAQSVLVGSHKFVFEVEYFSLQCLVLLGYTFSERIDVRRHGSFYGLLGLHRKLNEVLLELAGRSPL
jgi:hypothetical protein